MKKKHKIIYKGTNEKVTSDFLSKIIENGAIYIKCCKKLVG